MDMFSDAGVLGIFCIFAILLIKEVLPLIAKKGKNTNSESTNNEIERILRDVSIKVNKSLEMHEKYDSDGRPIWYIKEELEENIKMQKELLYKQNVILEKIAQAIEGQTKLIEMLHNKN